MIEITTFGFMVLTLIVCTLTRDYFRARRDDRRRIQMDQMALEWVERPVQDLIDSIGQPFELAVGLSARALYIWKSPPNDKLPPGSGLLTLTVTVEADGVISEIEWRDRT